ncbi:MAG: hypothetical protein NUV80_05440 [Candidatus Berkelbacteria bacterium]|nr:hypothetical protein [Candidatus Berkelbacteria bacterium]MCR4307979.1 hypothetical protein [Candidatus Berkelbacteria bacterium]
MKERGDILQDRGVQPEGETGKQETRSEVVESPETVTPETSSSILEPTVSQAPESQQVLKELSVSDGNAVVRKLEDLPADKTVDPVTLQELIETTMSITDTEHTDTNV